MTYGPFDYKERQIPKDALMQILPPSHAYFADLPAQFYAIGRKGSMTAKARTLGMELGQLVKTIYFEPEGGGPLFGAVIPGHVKIDERLMAAAIGLDKVKRATYMPDGMCPGSCGPFLSDKDIAKGTVEAIIWDIDTLWTTMDFAVPSREKLTMHMRFGDALSELRKREHPLYHGCLYHHEDAYRAKESLMLQTA